MHIFDVDDLARLQRSFELFLQFSTESEKKIVNIEYEIISMDIVDIATFVDLGSTSRKDENDVSDIIVNVLKNSWTAWSLTTDRDVNK